MLDCFFLGELFLFTGVFDEAGEAKQIASGVQWTV